MGNPSTRPRRHVRAVFRSLMLAVVFLVGVTAVLKSPVGQRWAGAVAGWYVSDPDLVRVRIGRLVLAGGGARIALHDIRAEDRAGAWLRIPRADILWRPGALLRGRIAIAAVTAPEVEILRQIPAGQSSGPLIPSLPTLPERIDIAKLNVHKPVFGQPASLRVNLRRAPEAGGPISLSVARIDRPGDGGRIELSAGNGSPPEIRIMLRESRGGIVAGFLGLDSTNNLSIDVSGRGAGHRWKGRARVLAGKAPLMDAELAVRSGDAGDLAVAAEGTIFRKFSATMALPAPLRSDVSFSARVRWQQSSGTLALDRLRLVHPSGEALLSGAAARETLSGRISAHVRGGAWVAAIVGRGADFAAAQVTGQISGPVGAPELDLKATLSRPSLLGVAAAKGEVSASLAGAGELLSQRRRLEAKIALVEAATSNRLAAALLGERPVLAVRGTATAGLRRWSGIEGRLSGAGGVLAISEGDFDTGALTGSAMLEASAPDIRRLDQVLPVRATGEVHAKGRIRYEREGTALHITGEARESSYGLAALDALLGPQSTFSGDVLLSNAGLSIRDVRVSSGEMRVTAGAELDLMGGSITARAVATVNEIRAAALSLGLPARGRGELELSVDGKLADPRVMASLRLPEPRLTEKITGPLIIRAHAKSLAAGATGAIDATLVTLQGQVAGSMTFSLADRSALRLRDIKLLGLDTRVAGNLLVPLSGGLASGSLTASTAAISKIAALAGWRADGRGRASLVLRNDHGAQTATVQFDGTDVVGDGVAAGSLTCTARLPAGLAAMPLHTDCVAERVAVSRWRMSRVAATLEGTASHAVLRLAGRSDAAPTHNFRAVVALTSGPDRLAARIERLSGNVGGTPLELDDPASVIMGPGREMVLTPAVVRLGTARIAAKARITPGSATGILTATNLRLAEIRPFVGVPIVKGAADLSLELRGTVARPELSVSLKIADAMLELDGDHATPAITGSLAGRFADGTMSLRAAFGGGADLGLDASAEIPTLISLDPFRIAIDGNAPVRSHLSWRGDVRVATAFLPPTGHVLDGVVNANLDARGPAARPQFTGTFQLRGGRYENVSAGTVLTGVELDGKVVGDRIQLQIGGSSGNGRFRGSGAVVLDRERGFPVSFSTKLDTLAAVQRDDMALTLSGGIVLSGSLRKLVVGGTLEVVRLEFNIAEPLPPEVVELPVTELAATTAEKGAGLDRPSSAGTMLAARLDLQVKMPGGVFVRGHGLETEWRGNMAVIGDTDAPSFDGKLELVRGHFQLAGKSFQLDQGSLTFVPSRGLDPTIAAQANYKSAGFSATVTASGEMSKPEIVFTSIPEMPRDEILSRILFGKGVTHLSRIEAAQLASAVASLSGLARGPGVLEAARKLLGVDILRIGGGKSGTAAIVGTRLTDRVYVGAEQGATSKSGRVQVEVQFLPGVKLKSGVNAEEQGSVGIELHWDY